MSRLSDEKRSSSQLPKPRPVLLGVLLVVSLGLFAAAVIWSLSNTPLGG